MITFEKSQEEMIGCHVVNVNMRGFDAGEPPTYISLRKTISREPLRILKAERKYMQNATYLVKHILDSLTKAGISYSEKQKLYLYQLILANEGLFKFSFLKTVGFVVTREALQNLYLKVPTIYEGLDNKERETVDFDRDMEALLKRKANGEYIYLYYMKVRARDHNMWYTNYAQVKNHWELGRMVKILEKSEHDIGFIGFKGLPYHMVIEGKHYDCVPLNTGDLPIEWTLRVEIPECTCGTANWEKTGFIGSDWT